jgi:hypothetical protein
MKTKKTIEQSDKKLDALILEIQNQYDAAIGDEYMASMRGVAGPVQRQALCKHFLQKINQIYTTAYTIKEPDKDTPY